MSGEVKALVDLEKANSRSAAAAIQSSQLAERVLKRGAVKSSKVRYVVTAGDRGEFSMPAVGLRQLGNVLDIMAVEGQTCRVTILKK